MTVSQGIISLYFYSKKLFQELHDRATIKSYSKNCMIEPQDNSNRITKCCSKVFSGTDLKSQPIKAQYVHYFYQPIAKPQHELCIS